MVFPHAAGPPCARHNLFFAIRPPAEIRLRIAEATAWAPMAGNPIRPDRLHITTLMLVQNGVVPAGMDRDVAEIAKMLRTEPFTVMFDRLVAGTHSMLLLPSERLEKLRLFRERLGLMLIRAGLDFRLEGTFSPHITLQYDNVVMLETEIDPIIWKVEDFVLIDSHIGQTRHVELGRWPLQMA